MRTFKNFKEHKQISLPIASADGMLLLAYFIAISDFLVLRCWVKTYNSLHHFFVAHYSLISFAFNAYISPFSGIYGGVCLAIRGPDCVVFFDWEDGTFIRKIDVVPQAIYWNEAGDSLVIVCSDCFYSLRYVLVCFLLLFFLFLTSDAMEL